MLTAGTVNVLKNLTFRFLFSYKRLIIKAGIHKMLVRIANREDPDDTADCIGPDKEIL